MAGENAFDDRGPMGPVVSSMANELLKAMQAANPGPYRPGRQQSKEVVDRRPGHRSILEILGHQAMTPWWQARDVNPTPPRVPGLDAIYPKGID